MRQAICGATMLLLLGCFEPADELDPWSALHDAGSVEGEADAGVADAGSDPSADIYTCGSDPECGEVAWCWQDERVGQQRLNAIWGAPSGEAWIAGDDGTLLRYDGERFTRIESGTNYDLRAVTGTGADDVWIAGARGTVIRWDGRNLKSHHAAPDVEISALFSPRRDQLWVAGSKGKGGVLASWEDGTWKRTFELDAPVTALAGVGSDLLIATEEGETLLLEAQRIESQGKRSVGLDALWVARPDLAFAVGGGISSTGSDEALIARWTGRSWSEDLHGFGRLLRGLHGTSSSDAWAVGTSGAVLRFDGTRWDEHETGLTADLQAVWAFDSDRVLAVGAGGAIGVMKRVACNP